MTEEVTIYCVDSDVLIHVGRSYRRDRFPTIWAHLEQMIQDGRLLAPDEVRAEIQRGDDFLVEWVKTQEDFFVPLGSELFAEFRRVEAAFPDLIDHSRPGPHADAFIVALALLINSEPGTLFEKKRCVVLTNEKRGGRHKIPTACDHFEMDVVDWFGFMEREGLEF